jgi:predicted small secreted protein
MKKLFVIATLTLLTGCATIEGVGRDISGGSRRVQSWF